MEVSTQVNICEDASETFSITGLLSQAGYSPTGTPSNATISSVVGPQWTSLVSLQGNESVSVNAGQLPNQNGNFNVSLTLLDAGAADPNINLSIGVTIDSENDAPTAVNASVYLGTATSYTVLESDFGFADANDTPPNAIKSVVITSVPATGQLQLSGAPLAAGAEVSIANIRAGNLVYVTATPPGGAAVFGFQVRDDGGNEGCNSTDVSTPHTFTITPGLPPPTTPPTPVPFMNDVALALVGMLLLAAAQRLLPRRRKGR